MNAVSCFQVNLPKVVAEVFEDDEVVIVNLDSGNYYSLAGSGAVIWNALAAGRPLAEIEAALAARYTGDHETLGQAVRALLDELLRENLIAPAGAGAAAAPEAAAPGGTRSPFTAPALQRYTDMQDLLLLDPIHDVDETGWPNLPASGA
jgi:hypothetical protein